MLTLHLPATRAWVIAGYLDQQRLQAAGTLLPGGGFLFAGGYGNCVPDCTLATTERYY